MIKKKSVGDCTPKPAEWRIRRHHIHNLFIETIPLNEDYLRLGKDNKINDRKKRTRTFLLLKYRYFLFCTGWITNLQGQHTFLWLKICRYKNFIYLCNRNERRCHSSDGRAKDWKSLCPRFDSWWHHKRRRWSARRHIDWFPYFYLPYLYRTG